MSCDFDVIVIGGGAGGGTLAAASARAGRRVLLLERGSRPERGAFPGDERAMLIEKRPFEDRTVAVNGTPRRLYIGGVLGGGTALYGAALIRPSEADFRPGDHYGDCLPASLRRWPIDYTALEPYYDEGERLFGVSGCAGDDLGPLSPPRESFRETGFPTATVNRVLVAANRAQGLKPFALPLAIDRTLCLRCANCPGFLCPTGARKSAADLLQRAIDDGHPLTVIPRSEVERLVRDDRGRVCGVLVRNRDAGTAIVYRAARYVLAAGAIGSPALLLRSGIDGPHVGRNYMAHLSPIVVGLFAKPVGGDGAFVKEVGFADYYLSDGAYRHKMGLIQSLPVPGPLMTAKSMPVRLPAGAVEFLRRRMLPLAGIVEDLPDPANRVTVDDRGGLRLAHRFSRYDFDRGRRLAWRMRQILRRAGARICLTKAFASEEHVAHQCGTLRFGRERADAVLDADCRVFDQPNVFVADASFFPTSLGVGPALTVVANALRVARIVSAEA